MAEARDHAAPAARTAARPTRTIEAMSGDSEVIVNHTASAIPEALLQGQRENISILFP